MSLQRQRRSPWRMPPNNICGLGLADDPIPIVPPEGFAGMAGSAIMRARTRAAMKEIPDWELLACFLTGPELVFSLPRLQWAREQESRLTTLRRLARACAEDGDRRRFEKTLHAARFRWRVLVERSVGYKLPRRPPVVW